MENEMLEKKINEILLRRFSETSEQIQKITDTLLWQACGCAKAEIQTLLNTCESNNMYDWELDEKFDEAVQLAMEKGTISTATLQRHFGMGYQRASKVIEQLEKKGIIGENIGTKPRTVLITREEYEEMKEI